MKINYFNTKLTCLNVEFLNRLLKDIVWEQINPSSHCELDLKFSSI